MPLVKKSLPRGQKKGSYCLQLQVPKELGGGSSEAMEHIALLALVGPLDPVPSILFEVEELKLGVCLLEFDWKARTRPHKWPDPGVSFAYRGHQFYEAHGPEKRLSSDAFTLSSFALGVPLKIKQHPNVSFLLMAISQPAALSLCRPF